MKRSVRIILIIFTAISLFTLVYQYSIGEPFKEPFHPLAVISVFTIMGLVSVIISFVSKKA